MKSKSLWMLFYPCPNSSGTAEPREDFVNHCPAADGNIAKSEGPHRTRGSAKGQRKKAATRGRSGFTSSHHPAGRTGATPGDIYSCCVFAKYLQSLTLLCVVAQVKTLELAREQSKMLLENVQMKHKQDMELMENTYK